MEGLQEILGESGRPGLPELRHLLQELVGGSEAGYPRSGCRLLAGQQLAPGVYRLQFDGNERARSLIVKLLAPDIAQRNQFVVNRWLPAIGLGDRGPFLLGAAAERSGQRVWHVYEDLGDAILDESAPDPEHVAAAVELVAQIHTRFARHPLLAECRLWGGDRGISFYTANVHDALRCLEALRHPLRGYPAAVELSPERLALRDRLLERLDRLLEEQPRRARAMSESGGPETLVHGDLWPKNILVLQTEHGLQARLIDWDRAGVGPVSYDLSTFLLRFPRHDRQWILALYRQSAERLGWRLPPAPVLNFLFETAECSRLVNRLIWPAIAVLEGEFSAVPWQAGISRPAAETAAWAFDELAAFDQWFQMLEPVLPL